MSRGWKLAAASLLLATGVAAADTPVDLATPALSSVSLAKYTRASQLIGAEIYARDYDVGEISDVIIDVQQGGVSAVIVSVNQLFGTRLVAVPSSAVKIGADAHLTIDLSPDALKAAPEFQYDNKSLPE